MQLQSLHPPSRRLQASLHNILKHFLITSCSGCRRQATNNEVALPVSSPLPRSPWGFRWSSYASRWLGWCDVLWLLWYEVQIINIVADFRYRVIQQDREKIIFLTNPKKLTSAMTQWFLGRLFRAVLVFLCFNGVKCVEFCLSEFFQYRTFASQKKAE